LIELRATAMALSHVFNFEFSITTIGAS
jgi:hypothetical protein